MSFAAINNVTGNSNTTHARTLATSNGAAPATGVFTAVSIPLNAGLTIKNISFVSGTTALGTPTHWGFAIYSTAATPALLGSTLDLLTTAWAANTTITKPLVTPVVIPKAGTYWVGLWVTAAAVPTLLSLPIMTAGLLNNAGIFTTDKALAITSGSGLTTAAPATLAAPAASLTVPIAFVS
jgi:hypothetical protein